VTRTEPDAVGDGLLRTVEEIGVFDPCPMRVDRVGRGLHGSLEGVTGGITAR
jgi:hypothetical protein